jgi:hypothetical protein
MGHRAWSKEYAARRARREVERDEDLKAEVTVKYETWESEGCEISHHISHIPHHLEPCTLNLVPSF